MHFFFRLYHRNFFAVAFQVEGMKPQYLLGALLLLGLLAVSPASAIVADSLNIAIDTDGNANVDVKYTLSWLEKIGVALNVANPAAEIRKACDEYAPGRVTQVESGDSDVSLYIERLATIKNRTYTTPALDFTRAEEILKSYPIISSILTIDLSPTVTTLTFPDGKVYTFSDQLVIPATTHVLNSGV